MTTYTDIGGMSLFASWSQIHIPWSQWRVPWGQSTPASDIVSGDPIAEGDIVTGETPTYGDIV